MKDAAPLELNEPLVAVCLMIFSASLALWVWIARRALRRQTIVPYQRRRPVPWQALDLLLVALCYYLAPSAIFDVDRRLFPALAEPAPLVQEGVPSTDHPVLALLRQDQSLATLVVCLAAVVLVAPVAEEILFRLLLQGSLEGLERRLRRGSPLAHGALHGLMPVLCSSVTFAILHFRGATPPPDARLVFHVLVCGMLGNIVTVVLAFALVQSRTGATSVDLGFRWDKLGDDWTLGLGTALVIIPWIYVLQLSLTAILPKSISPDPFTLIPFALVLGVLYYRTHRIIPSILVHMVLNATTLALAWYVLAERL